MSNTVSATRGSLARLRAFCLSLVTEKSTASPSRRYQTTEVCGPPSGFTVATVAKFLPSRILRVGSSSVIAIGRPPVRPRFRERCRCAASSPSAGRQRHLLPEVGDLRLELADDLVQPGDLVPELGELGAHLLDVGHGAAPVLLARVRRAGVRARLSFRAPISPAARTRPASGGPSRPGRRPRCGC